MAVIHIIRTPATTEQIAEMLQAFGTFVKLAVDIEREILAGGGFRHADCEDLLLQEGSKDELALKELYLRDAIPIRLGNLASSIKRLGFLIHSKKPEQTIYQLFQECRLFSTWTAPDAGFETRAELEALQRDFDAWQNSFQAANGNEQWRAEIAGACEHWANRILELSGLLKTGVRIPQSG